MMAASAGSAALSRYLVPTRIFIVVLGCLAIAWGAFTYPMFWSEASVASTARRIGAGLPFKPDELIKQIEGLDDIEKSTDCRPVAFRGVAVIRMRIVEEALAAGNQDLLDRQSEALIGSLRKALACAPSDSYLWFALFWAESTRSGFSPRYLEYLRMSYRTGPNEGWIAVRRNRFAFALYDRLPADLKESALRELVGIVGSYLYGPAADIITGPAWRLRDVVLPRLKDLPERDRRNMSDILQARGFPADIPGIQRLPERPWR